MTARLALSPGKRHCLASDPELTLNLAAADRLLFYTDGLTESANAEGRLLGQDRLSQIAAAALCADTFEMADRVLRDVARFRHGPPTDDMTLIAVEMK